MGVFKKIWAKYREIIFDNCTDEFIADTSLSFWQNRLFAASIMYLMPLSLVAILPGIYMAFVTELYFLIAIDILSIVAILFVAFVPRLNVFTRKIIFNGMLYLIAATLLFFLGSFGPGLLYLLGITIFIVLSLDKKYGYYAFALNTLLTIAVGFCIYFDWGDFIILHEYELDAWIAVSSNLIFLSGVAILLVPVLFDGLQSAIIEENKLRSELEYEEAKLKNTVQELHDKNKELEHFSYTISHDLKEPLRMIQNFMGLLEQRYGNQLDEKAHTYIHYATDGAQRMAKSIDDLLEYSRIGRLYINNETIDMNLIVEEIISNIKLDKNTQNVQIHYSNLPNIQAVPISIKILLQNLISNGIKYQPKGQQAEINIAATQKDEYWEFIISDNGIGMEPDHLEQIFGMFKRLHTREQYPGNGMGLAICKKIVEQHGGDIWVSSEPDKGSTFYFTLQKNQGNK